MARSVAHASGRVHADCDDARTDEWACARAVDHASLEASDAIVLCVRGPDEAESQC